MSKNQKGLLKWKRFFLKKWFCFEMLWNPDDREKVCYDKKNLKTVDLNIL